MWKFWFLAFQFKLCPTWVIFWHSIQLNEITIASEVPKSDMNSLITDDEKKWFRVKKKIFFWWMLSFFNRLRGPNSTKKDANYAHWCVQHDGVANKAQKAFLSEKNRNSLNNDFSEISRKWQHVTCHAQQNGANASFFKKLDHSPLWLRINTSIYMDENASIKDWHGTFFKFRPFCAVFKIFCLLGYLASDSYMKKKK